MKNGDGDVTATLGIEGTVVGRANGYGIDVPKVDKLVARRAIVIICARVNESGKTTRDNAGLLQFGEVCCDVGGRVEGIHKVRLVIVRSAAVAATIAVIVVFTPSA